MNLSEISVGDTVQFVVRVNNSSAGQPVQNVVMKVSEVTNDYIRGPNGFRSIELGEMAYRTYRVENIVEGTLWKLVG